MAAGLGSRYGGNKQVDGVGPNNEILMEYSIYDAIRAGFSKVVFIIKPEMEGLMHRLCGDYLMKKVAKDGTPFEVAYAFQDFSSVPNFYKIPAERTKPFGTVHALLCAADVVHEPFCVVNAEGSAVGDGDADADGITIRVDHRCRVAEGVFPVCHSLLRNLL